MTGASLPAEGQDARRRRTTLWLGVAVLAAIDVMLSPIFVTFVLLAGYGDEFSMTKLGALAVLMAGVLMCFACPIAAAVALIRRAPRRLVLVIALLPVLALPAAYAMLKALGAL